MAVSARQAQDRQESLEEIHASVPIPRPGWRRFLAFSGPAFMISVGYMDPGNWATDIQAGSGFGYRLLWILLVSNLMAILLQTLTARLGVVSGRDLAQACRETYSRRTGLVLWILCEIAIAACDLAEVIGTVIALKLLFGLPYLWGLVIAAGDTFLLLALQSRGIRLVELVTLGLIAVIAGSFVYEIYLSRPILSEVLHGLIPGLDTSSSALFSKSIYVAIAMLGATVMPHNLYLHSALVQTRSFPQTPQGKKLACKYNFFDSMLALNGAFFVNAAILILSVCAFYNAYHPQEVESLQDAHRLLSNVWGISLAGILFAVALLASGQSSTLTGTLAGQVVMEGFVRMRVRPWVRRMLTRLLAIVPALLVIVVAERASGSEGALVDSRLLNLLVLSQVVLSFQLPFAIVPLIHFTSDPKRMGEFANRGWLKGLAWSCAIFVVGLNAILIYLQIGDWAEDFSHSGGNPSWVYAPLGGLAIALAAFLGWITFYPWQKGRDEAVPPAEIPSFPGIRYSRIAVAVELKGTDAAVLAQAAALARVHGAALTAIHVVEGLGAELHGPAADDQESRTDRQRIAELTDHLRRDGFEAQGILGYGKPVEELVRIARDQQLDLLVIGTHGHRFLADLALGQTVAPVLHRLTIPVLVVPNRP